jgi:hypothetical protein
VGDWFDQTSIVFFRFVKAGAPPFCDLANDNLAPVSIQLKSILGSQNPWLDATIRRKSRSHRIFVLPCG